MYDVGKIAPRSGCKKNGIRLIGPQLWGDDPKRVADVISKKMKELLNRSDSPGGTAGYIYL